jgi:hypothetical protein
MQCGDPDRKSIGNQRARRLQALREAWPTPDENRPLKIQRKNSGWHDDAISPELGSFHPHSTAQVESRMGAVAWACNAKIAFSHEITVESQ